MITTKKPIIETKAKEGNEEAFFSEYVAGTIHLSGNSSYGLPFLSKVKESVFWPEFLGKASPAFSLRPLFVTGVICEKEIPWSFSRLIELGFNALMVEADQIPLSYQKLEDYGLKSILKPIFNKEDKDKWAQNFHELFKTQTVDYIFWESNLLHYGACREQLLFDQVLEEVSFLESLLGEKTKLIFYLPVEDQKSALRQVKGFSDLLNHVGQNTIVSFPAVAGKFFLDHQPFHPFWDYLKKAIDPSLTLMLPVYNSGAVGQGGGLWPYLTIDFAKHFQSVAKRHSFAGALCVTEKIPQKASLLDCNLWVAGHSQWHNREVDLLTCTWFDAERKELEYSINNKDLEELRNCIILLSSLKEQTLLSSIEFQKKCVEALFARLKVLEEKWKNKEMWSHYFCYFFRDAKRILFHHIQTFRLPFSNQDHLEHSESGFWTSLNKHSVVFHDKAICGEEQEMKKIFDGL